jgi:hypothetical protein
MSTGLQAAFEKPVVVPRERPLRLWCGEDGDSCAIRRAAPQKRAAASTVPKPCMGTAIDGGGEFGHLSHSLDSIVDSPYPCFSMSSQFSPFLVARIVMPVHVYVFLLVVCLLLCLARLGRLDWFHLWPSSSRGGIKRTTLHRLLKPRTPDDCPACQRASTLSLGGRPAPAPVRPWREGKSRRGARHSHTHRRLRLSQSAVFVLRDHRRTQACARWRWQAWSG